MLAVTPLVNGVGAGAVLALINQVLLHAVGRRVESLRLSARIWFDSVIWRHADLVTQAATDKAVVALDGFATSLAKLVERNNSTSRGIEDSAKSIRLAASQFHDVVQLFSTEITGVPEALRNVDNATAAAASALDELLHVGSRAGANLDVSVAAFRTTLDRDFATAAQLHYRSSKVLAESVEQIGEAAMQLKSGMDQLKQTAEANGASVEAMRESIRQHIVPGNQQFHDAVQVLTSLVGTLNKAVLELSSGAGAIAGQFDKVTGRLVPSVFSFCDAVDNQLAPAMKQHTQHVESVGSSIQRLHETMEAMSPGAKAFEGILDECSERVKQFQSQQDTLATMADNLCETDALLRNTIANEVAPTQSTMHDAAESFAQSARQLSDFIEQGVVPATTELASLHETLAGLADAVDLIKSLRAAREEIDRLSDTLARANEISGALSALPSQLNQNAAEPATVSSADGAVKRWLARRPR